MTTLGVAVKSGARPTLACVLIGGSADQPKLIESFNINSSEDDLVDQIEHLAKALGSKISGLSVSAVVVRSADFPPVPRRNLASDKRCMIEGAVAYVARSHGAIVHIRSGKEIGEILGSSKAAAESSGKTLDPRRGEAAAAALSGL